MTTYLILRPVSYVGNQLFTIKADFQSCTGATDHHVRVYLIHFRMPTTCT
jgi:hypothetical protein